MSRLGFLKWFRFAKAVLPYALAAAGVPEGQIGHVTDLAGDVEQTLGAGNGPAKLAGVLAGVRDGMLAGGHSDAEIDAVQLAVSRGLQTGIALANDVHKIAVEHAAHEASSLPSIAESSV